MMSKQDKFPSTKLLNTEKFPRSNPKLTISPKLDKTRKRKAMNPIHKLRETMKLTISEFALKFGKTPRTIYSYEMGERRPSVDTAKLFLEASKIAGLDFILSDFLFDIK